jgi:transcriptional regulator with XRE-family HTH domain
MTTRPDLQEVLRTNLRVLLALRKMTAGELAAHLDTDRTTVSKRMNGAREWALQDLVELSEVFDVPIDALIGETSQLLGVVPPRMTGTEDRLRRTTTQYFGGEFGSVVPLRLVSAS